MPVIEGDQYIGVLEIAMTIPKKNFEIEIGRVCKALEERDLKSSAQNENINLIDTIEDYSRLLESPNTSKKTRNSKSKMIARNDITKLFGLSKADAIKICCICATTTPRQYDWDHAFASDPIGVVFYASFICCKSGST
ncbi:hypothetical protein M8C21_008037 [Ambrosia artemisiifolia]|uniref:Uncharacterized protein n=1 Tax=Ambrosia artemisiifolia TaxID=4212 RepID=A0AAD5G1V7_AMBAR|nr:hypothetical protein M8C21_008037 [Ambrosia artemisiifolia]